MFFYLQSKKAKMKIHKSIILILVSSLVSEIKRSTQIEGVLEEGAEEKFWTEDRGGSRTLERGHSQASIRRNFNHILLESSKQWRALWVEKDVRVRNMRSKYKKLAG